MKLGQAMYEASQAGEGDDAAAQPNASAQGRDDVVDADFEEVQDDERKKSA